MAITLPLPVRVAAGLVATGIALVRSLPEEIPAIPVALVGNAMRLSMKVQQEITTLAVRGDELLGGLVGGRPQESPGWATFDEDTQPASTRAPARPTPQAAPAEAPADEQDSSVETIRHTPETTALSDSDTTATEAAAEVSDAVLEAVLETPTPTAPPDAPSADASTTDAADEPADTAGVPSADASNGDEPAVADGEPADADDGPADDGPAALPGYDRMTLAQVRGHLRELTADDVSMLLGYEQSGDNRAPFLTLLSNRLVTLGAQES